MKDCLDQLQSDFDQLQIAFNEMQALAQELQQRLEHYEPKQFYKIIREEYDCLRHKWEEQPSQLDNQKFNIKDAKTILKNLCMNILQGESNFFKSAILSEDGLCLMVSKEANKTRSSIADAKDMQDFICFKIMIITHGE